MRLLAVVQRYGPEIVGGAEHSCRELARRLVADGHRVEVLTSTSVAYGDWWNDLPTGSTDDDGVTVHRLAVGTSLDRATFEPLNERVIGAALAGHGLPAFAQREWLHALGPVMPGLAPWMDANVHRFDVVSVHTLGYWHGPAAVAAVSGRRPVVLHPLAHVEPSLALQVFDDALLKADGFAFLTDEERSLIEGRTEPRPCVVLGLGVGDERAETATAGATGASDGASSGTADHRDFLARADLRPDEPYVIYVGRVDRAKGIHRLADAYGAAAYGAGADVGAGRPPLVVVGDVVHPLASTPTIRVVGKIPGAALRAAVAGAVALVHPSPFESFAIVLAEAWRVGTPTLVTADCAVLVGQCRRSGGGLAWRDLAELHEQIAALIEEPGLRAALGARGRLYVRQLLQWDEIIERYEQFLAEVVDRGRSDSAVRPSTTVGSA